MFVVAAVKLAGAISNSAVVYANDSRSQWPRGLRRRSTAARLLRLWVRIPPGAWVFVVSVVCCQVEVSATSSSLV